MRGLNWLVDRLGPIGALDWSFRQQGMNHYGPMAMFRDVVIPDLSIPDKIEPHPDMVDFDMTDRMAISGEALSQCKAIPGINYSLIELAFSYDEKERLRAVQSVKNQYFDQYPITYLNAVCLSWMRTYKMRPAILLALSGVSDTTERKWRGKILEELKDIFDKEIGRIK